MALQQRMVHAVGFILSQRENVRTGAVEPDEPIGTGFAVFLISEDDYVHAYVITADHVVPDHEPCYFEATRYDGSIIHPYIELNDWWRPFEGVDLAICALPTAEVRSRGLPMFDIFGQSWPHERTHGLGLGQVVHYIGLLAPFDTPMARTGTIGSLFQRIEPVEDYPYGYAAHFIDCRSYGGFSGSPVFLETKLTKWEPQTINEDLARTMPEEVRKNHFGVHVDMGHLFGMLAAHLDDDRFDRDTEGNLVRKASRHGVAIVLPVEVILAGLDCEHLRMVRKRRDREAAAKDKGPPIVGAAREKQLKRDMDERISLAPLTVDEALKGLLETPPPETPTG